MSNSPRNASPMNVLFESLLQMSQNSRPLEMLVCQSGGFQHENVFEKWCQIFVAADGNARIYGFMQLKSRPVGW